MKLELEAVRDVRVRALLEWQADVQADRLSAGLARTAICRFHDARAAARRDDEAVILGFQRDRPRREQPRQLARIFVEPRPLERLATLSQLRFVLVAQAFAVFAPRAQRLQRPLSALAAVDARRSEKDDRVLDLLFLEAAKRLEVFSEDTDRSCIVAVEKLRVLVRERLLGHPLTVISFRSS